MMFEPFLIEPDETLARRNVERLVQRNRQAIGEGGPANEIGSVGIVGAGMMGVSIAAAHLAHEMPVVVTDADETVLAALIDRIAAELAQQTGATLDNAMSTVARLARATASDREVAACDLVLETVVESLSVKRAVYRRLEPRLRPDALLATNTSTIPVSRLSEGLARPSRFCGLHFFHPVRHRSLVEVVRGERTGDAATVAAARHARSIGKMPIVVRDGPGFAVNRLLVRYLSEALEMLLEGATIAQIEEAATWFGMAMGPLRAIDEIGMETTLLAGRQLWDAFPERIAPSPLVVTMVKRGRLGRKSGRGFFAYDRPTAWDGPGEPDPTVEQLIAQWAGAPKPLCREEMAARLILPMVVEATLLLEERKVCDPRDVDLAVVFGLGFPARRGGLLYWVDQVGAGPIVAMLRSLDSLGPRARPTALLLEAARTGRRLYDGLPPGLAR